MRRMNKMDVRQAGKKEDGQGVGVWPAWHLRCINRTVGKRTRISALIPRPKRGVRKGGEKPKKSTAASEADNDPECNQQ